MKNINAVALGCIKSEKKANSSRENGKKGGRPVYKYRVLDKNNDMLPVFNEEMFETTQKVRDELLTMFAYEEGAEELNNQTLKQIVENCEFVLEKVRV